MGFDTSPAVGDKATASLIGSIIGKEVLVYSGITAVTTTAANTAASVGITFPAGLFPSAPIILTTVQTTVGAQIVSTTGVASSTTAGTITLTATLAVTRNVGWIAIVTQ
jgi:hypothetical protein